MTKPRSSFFLLFTLFILFPLLPARAVPLPPQVTQQAPLQLLGEGDLTLFFFHIYKASFYSAQKPWSPQHPYALALQYQRDYTKEDLLKATADEMNRITKPNPATLARWQEELATIYPDVKKGERITAFFYPPSDTHFYHNDAYLGQIRDQTFTKPFFDIWLGEKTREPRLRDRLLGLIP